MTIRNSVALLALGGNLPWHEREPADVLHDALAALAVAGLVPDRVSRFYRTPCFPAGAGPDYVNAAALVRTGLLADQVLEVLHTVEAQFGRERRLRWARRTLDLDLIALDETVLPDPAIWARWHDLAPDLQGQTTPGQLILPHPRLQDRAFVLVPLADIAPDWCHPVLRKTVAQMVLALPQGEIDAVRPI